LGSTPPSEVENTKSDSGQDLFQKIIDTAPQEVLDAYDLAPPQAPKDPTDFDSWWSQNSTRFSSQAPTTEEERQQYIDSVENAYVSEVYQPYKDAFDAYESKFNAYRTDLSSRSEKFFREANPTALKSAVDNGDFSGVSLNEERDVPVIIGGELSYRSIYNTSDMLQGLSIEDGTLDEWLDSQIDKEAEKSNITAEIDSLKQRVADIRERMPNAVVSGLTKEIER